MFSRDVLEIDVPAAVAQIQAAIRRQVMGVLRRRGAVVGLSGGIDSSVVAALCVGALGPERVAGLLMPERDSSSDSLRLGRLLAEHLEIPDEIRRRPTTTDTFSMPQSQEEFYFSLPYDKMDLCLYGKNHGVPASDVARTLELTAEQVERVYKDIDQKRRTTAYLHTAPLLVEPVPEVHP
jgi:NH3-dependent NAD+ synthetase